MSPAPSTRSGPRRIAAANVHYLAFEGGGGAGNAFPGALSALQSLNVLKYQDQRLIGVWGIAGSSAGAITALFLSMGYTPREMETILAGQDFNEFFDPVRPGFVPRIGGCVEVYTPRDTEDVLKSFSDSLAGRVLLTGNPLLRVVLAQLGRNMRLEREVTHAEWGAAGFLASLFLGAIGQPSPGAFLDQVMKGVPDGQLFVSLMSDYGIFSGQAIRNFFAKGITNAVRRVQGLPDTATTLPWGSSSTRISEITFEQHYSIFGCKLVVTGSNLETGKTELFSVDTTPKFVVADAVRISMSIPIAYKPLVLKEDRYLSAVGASRGSFVEGVWVDGGVFNNTPVDVFDQHAGSQEQTVALRLRVDGRRSIDNFIGFYGAYPLGMAAGTGESQVSSSLSPLLDRTIELPVTDQEMGLFTFSPDPSVYKRVNERSRQTVMDYFR